MTSEKISMSQPPVEPFEYMLYEGDPDHLKTIVSSPRQNKSPRIDPEVLKLTHRIGRGPFGDVWVATQHLFSDDYDQYHEVAVKMLHPIKEDQISAFLAKFDEVFFKCQGLKGVCILQGVSIKMGKVCIAMKFYEGSVGDKMARLKEGKLPLPTVIKYGIDLANAIIELHSRGTLVLNIKPNNLLLDEEERVILGDFGIPHLLMGFLPSNSEMVGRLGTVGYMAPEQFEAELRGPVAAETDSWGVGCCILEMLTGLPPWWGRNAEEVRRLVVGKQKRPEIPAGLPAAMEDLLHGCFEYDLRDRPLMGDILRVLESCRDDKIADANWTVKTAQTPAAQPRPTDWALLKDTLLVGDTVRSRKPRNSGPLSQMLVPEGTIVGVDTSSAANVLVRVHGIHGPLRLPAAALERVSFGFAAGDWVRIRHPLAVGILHSVDRSGAAAVGIPGSAVLWRGGAAELEMAPPFHAGQFIRLKDGAATTRFPGWQQRRNGSPAVGRIQRVLPNGCLLVNFPGLISGGEAVAEAAEVEAVSFSACEGVAAKYWHLEDCHWAVRPVAAALGFLAAVKLGVVVKGAVAAGKKNGGRVAAGKKNGGRGAVEKEGEGQGAGSGSPGWLPPPVANILFKEGSASSQAG